ncbi:hypothetical protein KC19_VG256000 [Ceratodon purpureus]|uniref:Uncharacterized protein n=1 Tax=Ceratodon purpureus TaxID=3225 RepID=A0A8T0HTH9_CERPU|nr:hypothetical protein KC19_VG256000 [Ceratodon purpureus]
MPNCSYLISQPRSSIALAGLTRPSHSKCVVLFFSFLKDFIALSFGVSTKTRPSD